MSKFLYSIGKRAFDKPWHFIVSWVAILGILVAMLFSNGIHLSSEMKIEGTEAQNVLDKLAKELPEASGGQGSVVFTSKKGERLDTPERLAAISKAVNEVYTIDHVINPADYAKQAAAAASGNAQGTMPKQAATAPPANMPPYGPLMINGAPLPGMLISTDGNVALFQFQFTVQQTSVPKEVQEKVIEAVMATENGTGITALPSESLTTGVPGASIAEVIGIAIAAVVLFITLGSLVTAGLPLLVALFGVAVGLVGAFSISKFFNMGEITPVLALMIGLAVGIDYSLFIVNRQRRMILDQGLSAREAASRAIGTAGSAVFFAGLTVIIALCGMLVIGIQFLSAMALVAAATVFISVLVALTLLPALLGLLGERICSTKLRNKSLTKAANHRIASGWVNGVVKYRWLVIVGIIAVLGVAAIPVTKMNLGIPSAATANLDSTTRQSYDAISNGFGEGFNGPLLLVAEASDSSGKVSPESLGKLVGDIQKLEDVSLVTPMGMNKTGDMAILNLIPKSGPTDEATKNLVKELRDPSFAQKYNVTLGVTGFTAINIDMSDRLTEVFPLYVVIIVILSLIILLLVFRSIIVPIKATVGFLLSVLATFGLTTAVFQWGWLHSLFGIDNGGPLLSFMPILVTGILYGLAMDYQVFLVSSMRESYVHGHRGIDSVVHGYKQSSLVVVAAAIIMVSVFAGFIFTDDIMIKQIGFALAIGILIDSFLIRMTLVPAVMAVFGDKAWGLPKWLDRILPNLDVEGDKLLAELNKSEEGEKAKVAHSH
ncbi:putative drug exporter of the RND superfamily [Paenibacillaceae bacterium GAS479]|nr:putative drug exporter of the RND superfamily [Paenibacillaceae bacterium GAS479]